MISNDINPNIETLQDECRLVGLAQSGDADAFVQLYDAYVEGVYRFVYFRVINDKAAEDITSQVFLNAWEHIHNCPMNDSTFVQWISEIAGKLVTEYYKTDLKNHPIDVNFLSVPADYGLNKEVQDLIKLEVMRNHLRFLAAEPKQSVILKFINYWTTNRNIVRILSKLEGDIHYLQVSTLETVAKFLEYLNLGREVKPDPAFNARTRLWLAQYLQFHSRRPQRSSTLWRMSLIYAILIATFIVTGTAKAQSALPGDVLYGWKRTSEQAWLSMSPDPVGTNIMLANRRLNEWIAVEDNPAQSTASLNDYYIAINQLKSTGNPETSARILPVLKAHKQRLNDTGLSTVQLDNYLTVGVNTTSGITSVQSSPIENVTVPNDPNITAPPAKDAPSQVIPAPSDASNQSAPSIVGSPIIVVLQPTQISPAVATPAVTVLTAVPPVTDVSSVVAPISTDVSTTAASAPTQATTGGASGATIIPSVVAPPATDIPSVVAPPVTDVPSAVPPPATQAPIVTAPPATQAPVVTAPPATQPPIVAAPPATVDSSGITNPPVPANNPAPSPVATP